MKSPVLSQVRITGLAAGTQLTLNIDRAKAAALGVDFNEAASRVSTAVGSAYLSKFPNMGRMQNIWVQADAPYRMQLSDILKLNARNAQGGMVPLSTFVSAEWVQGPRRGGLHHGPGHGRNAEPGGAAAARLRLRVDGLVLSGTPGWQPGPHPDGPVAADRVPGVGRAV
ncbi:hypothetical protein G6F68_015239 [Rhizopus microsporus]|nr:hypothetical protein G6F68_015239 [Rhizopus microsporus]